MKRLTVFCFMFLFVLPCFSQEQEFLFLSDTQAQSVNWDALEQNLNELEQSLVTLQTSNANLQKALQSAQNSVAIQKEYLAWQSIRLQDLENSCAQSEKTMKRWRLACGITVAVTVPTIVILAIVVSQQNK